MPTFKKNVHFQGPCDLKKNENFAARAPCTRDKIRRFFGIELIKCSQSITMCPTAHFRKAQKMKIAPPYYPPLFYLSAANEIYTIPPFFIAVAANGAYSLSVVL